MSTTTLAKLKFVTATRPVSATNNKAPELSRREKLVAGITEQLNLINAEITGKPYIVTKTKKDKLGNVTNTTKKLRSWFWKDSTGAVLCEVKYGSTALLIADNRSAFKSASNEELVKNLKLVQTAVTAGELDSLLKSAAAKRAKKVK